VTVNFFREETNMMKTFLLGAVLAATMVVPSFAADAPAAPTGVKRTELQRWDVPGTAYTGVNVTVEFEPNSALGLHTHPGVEMTYVLSGTVTISVQGQPDKTYKAGEFFKIDGNVPHSAKNASSAPFKGVATYVVEKDKPLASPVK